MGNETSEPSADTRKWSDWPPSPTQWIAAIFILVAAVVAATWHVSRAVSSERVANLQSQLDQVEAEPIPKTTESEATQLKEVAELATRIESLEQQKNALVAQMAELSRDALDPRSELGVLVRQLESDDQPERLSAATGLFAIRDQRTVQPLMDYYRKYPEEAWRAAIIDSYMRRALWDRRIGIDFVMSILQSDDAGDAEDAFDLLVEEASGEFYYKADDFDELIRPALESLALRSDDALVRTRAKVLLEKREEWVDRMKELYAECWPPPETATEPLYECPDS
jgi:hypothetical protein